MLKNKEKKEKKTKKEHEEKNNKFLEIIKKRWLINGSKTLLLVVIILGIFIGITMCMQKLDLTPIDLTEQKLFTLTEESKEQIRNINFDNSNVNIYFVGYSEDDSTLDLARQYTKVTDKISVEAVTANDRPDLVEKYGIESGSEGIIVENGDKYKVLSSSDLYTYDSETYESVSIAEEKLTPDVAIVDPDLVMSLPKSVTADTVPKIYFLTGYSQFSLTSGMQYLNMYLQNEINEIASLDILSTGKVPDDCNTLVITTPNKDFDDIATNAIMDYINKGGNILWLNSAIANQVDYTNVNKILATYGVNPFEVGAIRETDTSKMVSQSPDLIIPEIQYSDVTKKIYNSTGVIFLNATKINVVDSEALSDLKVTKTDLIKTSEGSYFRSNFKIQSEEPQEGEEKQAYLVGAELEKTITEANSENGTEEVKSKLIIYGENYFVSDAQLSQSSQTPIIAYRQNKDLALNSIAYLSNREEDITVRKGTGTVKYTATEQESRIILAIITAVPILIILIGIVVWISRKRKK